MGKQKKAARGTPGEPPTVAAEEYTVLARRYRPQQFGDLVGQEAVAQALRNALEGNRVAHAYLFTGPRGVGKTSTARILAKALNCRDGPTPTPCDRCDLCRAIAAGDDVDVLEIDGASNRGIDEVREIRQNVQYRPARARYKIYIIDEVHMLTKEAFNALLKTLEEPPPHVKFLFATTEVQRIPVTILSRCQRFDFAGISAPRIVERLKHIAGEEGVAADDEALELVARRAAGSMRDAQSLLDQMVAFAAEGGRLEADEVHRLLGTATDEHVVALASAVLGRDAKQALRRLAESLEQGLHPGELADQLMEYWRDLMVVKCAGAEGVGVSVGRRHRETLQKQAAAASLDTVLAGLDVLAATKARLRGSRSGRVLLEMALVRLSRLDDLVPLAQVARLLEGRVAEEPAKKNSRPADLSRPAAADPRIKSNGTAAGVPLSEVTWPEIWAELLRQVGPILGSNLEKAEFVAIPAPNTLVIRFPPPYNLQREHCSEATRIARAEEALRRLTGQPWTLRIETGSNEASDPPAPQAEADPSPSRYHRQRAEAMQQPLVRRAVDLYGAQIVQLDEGFGAADEPVETADDAPAGEKEER